MSTRIQLELFQGESTISKRPKTPRNSHETINRHRRLGALSNGNNARQS
jgi:hypothetical protein